jgi:hypothetical protein
MTLFLISKLYPNQMHVCYDGTVHAFRAGLRIRIIFCFVQIRSQNSKALEAQNRAVEGRGRSQWRPGGSKWTPVGSIDQWSGAHHFEEELDPDPDPH